MDSKQMDLSRLSDPIRQKLEARLSRLPPEVRARLMENLGKVPPQMLAEFVERGSPMLDKLLAKAEQQHPGQQTPARVSPPVQSKNSAKGFYSQTVQRGDRASLPLSVIVLLAGAFAYALYLIGLFGS